MNIFKKLFSSASVQSEPGRGNAPSYSFGRPSAGINVNESTALNLSAVFCAVRVISESLAQLPFRVYENLNDYRIKRPDHPLDLILHTQANSEICAYNFKETLTSNALLFGNGYAEIERNRAGNPVALWPLNPNYTKATRDSSGKIVYEVRGGEGGNVVVMPASDVFHLKGLSFDGLVGYSPIALARESLSLSMALEQFGASFFGNGAALSGVLETPSALSDKAYDRLKETWDAFTGTKNAHKTRILEEGLKYTQISVPPEDAQFLASRQFQVTEIARWFRVPPHKLYELSHATFSNIEHQSKEFIDDTLSPWAERWEQEAQMKLLAPEERGRIYTKMDFKRLLRGDATARSAYYNARFNNGSLSINEIRRLEDENGIGADGDLRVVPMNMVSIKNAGGQNV